MTVNQTIDNEIYLLLCVTLVKNLIITYFIYLRGLEWPCHNLLFIHTSFSSLEVETSWVFVPSGSLLLDDVSGWTPFDILDPGIQRSIYSLVVPAFAKASAFSLPGYQHGQEPRETQWPFFHFPECMKSEEEYFNFTVITIAIL